MTAAPDPGDRPVPRGPTWRPPGYGEPTLDGDGIRLGWAGRNIARLRIDERHATMIEYGFCIAMVAMVAFAVRLLGIDRATHWIWAGVAVALLLVLVVRPPWKATFVIEIDKRRQCVRRSTGWRRRPAVSAIGPFERLTLHRVPTQGRELACALRLTGAEGARQLMVGPAPMLEDYGTRLSRWLGVPLERGEPIDVIQAARYEAPRATA